MKQLFAMGNSLVGIAPSQIFPLEHYMADIAELQLEKRLDFAKDDLISAIFSFNYIFKLNFG